MNETAELQAEYIGKLRAYLAHHDEEMLSSAYELGRRALAQGMGVLDMAALHDGALATLAEEAADAASCALFFHQLLSPFEMSLRGYRAANQELKRLNGVLRHQKEELELVNRELESFSYTVSHDLMAPLRSISGFSQALLEGCADKLEGRYHKYLTYVHDAAREMNGLIQGLLDLSRVTRHELERAPVELAALAEKIADRLRETEPQRAVEFVIEPGLAAEGDPRLLTTLLENLLGNAWKYSAGRSPARIELGSLRRNDERVFFVRDNGAGFDMALSEHLFAPFQRLHAAKEFEGSGIGLATVQRIVHRHGGKVWAEAAVDRGATFYFTLGGGQL